MEHRSTIIIPSVPGTSTAQSNTTAAAATPATQYATLAALLAALAAIAGAVYVDTGQPLGTQPSRLNVWPKGVGAADTDGTVDVYEVRRTGLAGGEVMLQKVAAVAVTLGADACTGGGAGNVWAKTCTLTSTGRMEAATGGALAPAAFPAAGAAGGAANPAGFTVFDNGEAIGYVLIPGKGTATSLGLLVESWR